MTTKSPAQEWGSFVSGRSRLLDLLVELRAKRVWSADVPGILGDRKMSVDAYVVNGKMVLVQVTMESDGNTSWDVFTSVAPDTIEVNDTLYALRKAVAK